jgi:hypothetical protein
MEDSDRTELADFLWRLRELLKLALFEHEEWFPADLRRQIDSAWNELQPLFSRATEDIQSGEFDQELEREGLTGSQLRFKLAGFSMASDDFTTEAGRAWRRRTPGFLRRVFDARGRLLKLFKVALDWANVILDSIGKVIAPAGAVGEFKKAVESAIHMNEEGRGRWWQRLLGIR